MRDMAELPSGTVTLLFSDIEGSTSLLARLGSAYGDFADGQREIFRAAWASHEGTELGTEGDSFFVAFPTAEAAVLAAAAAQRVLARHPWPDGAPARVRMGIHTGSPSLHDGGYVGMDVHRAAGSPARRTVARCSSAPRPPSSPETPCPTASGCVTSDGTGSRTSRVPEHLFQLAVDGLQVEFPALKSLGAGVEPARPRDAARLAAAPISQRWLTCSTTGRGWSR